MLQVNRYKTSLDECNAYWMARLSQVAYIRKSKNDPTPSESKILKNLQAEDPGFLSVKGFSKNSAQAIIVEHQWYITAAFRGTDELADWRDNIDLDVEETAYGEFHSGFLESVDDLWDDMVKHYEKLRTKQNNNVDQYKYLNRPLFLTGHSLGGAMATIAAAKLLHHDKPFSSLYTFGQPRAVSRETRVTMDTLAKDRMFRFQNNSDIVSRVPARLRGYSHVGKCIYISEEGELHTDPGFWFRFLDVLDGAVQAAKKLKLDLIYDHRMENYLSGIKSWKIQN